MDPCSCAANRRMVAPPSPREARIRMDDARYERPLATRDVSGISRNSCMVGVLGVYGKGNLGDEALLRCIADDVHACLPDAEILAICSNPETVRDSLGFRAIRRSPWRGFIHKLRRVPAKMATKAMFKELQQQYHRHP